MTTEEEIKDLQDLMERARLRVKAALFLREASEEQIKHVLCMAKLLTGNEPYEHVIFAGCQEMTECKIRLMQLVEPVCD